MASAELSDEQYRAIYAWIDAIPLSRPKRNIARDFSDGVMLAEVIAAYFPQLVELHNYPPANSLKQKIYNFETLNVKVLKKLGFTIPRPVIEDIVACKAGAVEQVLNTLQYKMAKYREKKSVDISSPSANEESAANNRNDPVAKANVVTKPAAPKIKSAVEQEILLEKEEQIRELQETVEILELKVAKLEQLVRLKDSKIQKLMAK